MQILEIIYNGPVAERDRVAVEGLKQVMLYMLEPLEDEILECGGKITIEIANGMLGLKTLFSNMPADLVRRVKIALQKKEFDYSLN